jgi:hypothetical protein
MPNFHSDVRIIDDDLILEHDGEETVRVQSDGTLVIRGVVAALLADLLRFDPGTGQLTLGAASQGGGVSVVGDTGAETARLDGAAASVRVGAQGVDGTATVVDAAEREVIRLEGASARLQVGADGSDGNVAVADAAGREVLRFDGQTAQLTVGAAQNEGDIFVRDTDGRNAFRVDGGTAQVFVGTAGNEGDLHVFDSNGRRALRFDGGTAQLWLGAEDNEGDLRIRNDAGNETIHLNGATGDIILRNGDAAEDFDVADPTNALPGTVMVLDDDGRLRPCAAEHDRRVVGVVAGAGTYRPGVILDRDLDCERPRAPISIMGKVAVCADASRSPIRPGDLLTTSETMGCAKAVGDPAEAAGAVLGKALTPLRVGVGMVDMLIALQ